MNKQDGLFRFLSRDCDTEKSKEKEESVRKKDEVSHRNTDSTGTGKGNQPRQTDRSDLDAWTF